MSDSIAYCGQQLLGVSITIAIVQILVVGGRLYTRQMQKVAYGIDDYLIIAALVRTSESIRSILVVHTSMLNALHRWLVWDNQLFIFIVCWVRDFSNDC